MVDHAAARGEPDPAFDAGLARGDHRDRIGDRAAPHGEFLRFLGGLDRLARHDRGVEAAGDEAGALQRVAPVQLREAAVVADADAERPGRAGVQREAQVARGEVPLLQDRELAGLVRFDLARDMRLPVPAGGRTVRAEHDRAVVDDVPLPFGVRHHGDHPGVADRGRDRLRFFTGEAGLDEGSDVRVHFGREIGGERQLGQHEQAHAGVAGLPDERHDPLHRARPGDVRGPELARCHQGGRLIWHGHASATASSRTEPPQHIRLIASSVTSAPSSSPLTTPSRKTSTRWHSSARSWVSEVA